MLRRLAFHSRCLPADDRSAATDATERGTCAGCVAIFRLHFALVRGRIRQQDFGFSDESMAGFQGVYLVVHRSMYEVRGSGKRSAVKTAFLSVGR